MVGQWQVVSSASMALPPPDLHSTCLVTGASSGIGADIARALAQRGHGSTLVARRAERLEELATELRDAHGVRVEVVEADLADAGSRAKLLSRLTELKLSVEVLVNNAGFGSGGLFHELDPEREVGMVQLNVEAVIALCGRFVPEMVRRGRGGVLNVASTAAFQPLPRQATYGATKAFVLSFTDALHGELAGTGVSATALCPGPVRTEFADTAGIGEEAEGLPDIFWADSPDVAEQGVHGLERNRRVVVPGMFNRAGALGGQHVPRSLLLRVAGRLSPVGR
jgi:short-subunit dehydrogenase